MVVLRLISHFSEVGVFGQRVSVKAVFFCFITLLLGTATLFANDLRANLISGSQSATVGQQNIYTVSVTNVSNSTVVKYTVLLQNGNTTLASIKGVSLAPGVSTNFTLTWVPANAGNYIIQGYV